MVRARCSTRHMRIQDECLYAKIRHQKMGDAEPARTTRLQNLSHDGLYMSNNHLYDADLKNIPSSITLTRPSPSPGSMRARSPELPRDVW